MAKITSKFDVRDHGTWSEIQNTIKFSGYVVLTFVMWSVYGFLVRRAYKKACDEGREYFVDNMPGGHRPK